MAGDETSIDRALVAAADTLRPNGVFAVDLCDLQYGEPHNESPEVPTARLGEDWAIIYRIERPSRDRFVRIMATFVRDDDDCWRRDDETHVNVLIDTGRVPDLLADRGLEAQLGTSFGDVPYGTKGLVTVVGHKGRQDRM